MNIDNLKAVMSKRHGPAKPNLFEISFSNLPRGIADDNGRDLTILCESTLLPGKQIMSYEWSAFGHNIKVPTNFIQEDVSCVFTVTNDYYVKNIFDKWQNRVINNEKFQINYDEDFKATITLHQLDEADRPIYEYILYGAYPITVASLVLDNNIENQVQKLPVTFSYNDYKQTKL